MISKLCSPIWIDTAKPNLLCFSEQNPAAPLSIGSILLLSKGSGTLEEAVTSLYIAGLLSAVLQSFWYV